MPDPSAVLRYSVRPRVVLKYLGQLAFVLALLTAVPMVVALLSGLPSQAGRYAQIIVLLFVLAAASRRQPTPKYIQTNEALTVITLAFLMASVLMAYPMMGAGLSVSAAYFESVSGITTTGLTTLSSVEDRIPSFLFARAWMQWCGGLGFVVLSVALVMGNEMAARRLTEPYGSDTMLTTTRTYARRMLGVYLTLTLCGFAIMWATLGGAFAAAIHTLAAVSTGGFSGFDLSLGALGSWTARYSVIGVALCGAIPLPLYLVLRRSPRKFFRDPELRTLILAVVAVGLVMAVLFHGQGGTSWPDALGHGVLMGISAQTTTGFSTIDVDGAGNTAILLMTAAMFIGGGLGSTAGGIKLLRVLILLHVVSAAIRKSALSPHAVEGEGVLGERRISDDDIRRTFVLIILYLIVTALSWLVFVAHGFAPLESLFEVVSAVGTVGLSTGITSAELSPFLKGVLCVDMLLGRLEIFAFVVLLYPPNWFGNRVD